MQIKSMEFDRNLKLQNAFRTSVFENDKARHTYFIDTTHRGVIDNACSYSH